MGEEEIPKKPAGPSARGLGQGTLRAWGWGCTLWKGDLGPEVPPASHGLLWPPV